jgi:hypothetical protein
MSKQSMNINALPEFIANTFGTSEVLVENNNRIITIEPMLTDTSDSTKNQVCLVKPLKIINGYNNKPGTLTLDDFKSIELCTKGYKFKRDDAYERD